MSRFVRRVCVPVLLLFACAPVQAVTIIDFFIDGSMGPEWALIEDSPSEMWLLETTGRLELHSTGPASPTTDALYISDGPDGFQLPTAHDFAIGIAYEYPSFSGAGAMALTLGIGRDLAGTDSAAIGYSRTNIGLLDGAVAVATRVGDAETITPLGVAPSTSGAFGIAYLSATDRLAFHSQGLQTHFDGLVQGTWGADSVYVAFGGRGAGLTLDTGDAWLHSFTAVSQAPSRGAIPEPATLSLLAMGAAAVIR